MFHEYRDLITELKQKDAHFTKLFDKHNALDDEIVELCMAHRECFEKRSGMEHLAVERIEALSADIGGD